MDIFDKKEIKPMLIGEKQEAFDDPNYIFELKMDGIRCIAYLDEHGVDLRNKRNIQLLEKVPELSSINKQIHTRCILDGELIVIKDGIPNFFEIQRRSIMSNTFKIKLASSKYPASFIAFDILYYDNEEVTKLPLIDRKKLLNKTIIENEQIAISRYIESSGVDFYEQAEQKQLEGIVAKQRYSKYYFNKRTKDWIKIKHFEDDDFIVCGYYIKTNNATSLILGQYTDNILQYKGSVIISQTSSDFNLIQNTTIIQSSPLVSYNETTSEAKHITWIEPTLVCNVQYMMLTASGSMRQPVFKGLRKDKVAKDCVTKKI